MEFLWNKPFTMRRHLQSRLWRDTSETAKPLWVDDGINIQRCSSVPSAVPLKYDSITLWDKMNRIHHFDVFVRFVRLDLGLP